MHQRFLEDDRDLGRSSACARAVPSCCDAPTGAGGCCRARRSGAARLRRAPKAAPEVRPTRRALLDPNAHRRHPDGSGLFGGPLFTVHKAATAIRLCREINAEPGPRVAVVLEPATTTISTRANRLFLVNQAQEVQRFRLELNAPANRCARSVGRDVERCCGRSTRCCRASTTGPRGSSRAIPTRRWRPAGALCSRPSADTACS
jgi:hypothetical protein